MDEHEPQTLFYSFRVSIEPLRTAQAKHDKWEHTASLLQEAMHVAMLNHGRVEGFGRFLRGCESSESSRVLERV